MSSAAKVQTAPQDDFPKPGQEVLDRIDKIPADDIAALKVFLTTNNIQMPEKSHPAFGAFLTKAWSSSQTATTHGDQTVAQIIKIIAPLIEETVQSAWLQIGVDMCHFIQQDTRSITTST